MPVRIFSGLIIFAFLLVMPVFCHASDSDGRMAGSVVHTKPKTDAEEKEDTKQNRKRSSIPDDRMAGTKKPMEAENTEKSEPDKPAKEKKTRTKTPVEKVEAPKPSVPQQINFRTLESYGVLTSPAEGSLGRDLWRGSKRSDLITALTELPPENTYRVIQDLIRRALLTQADSSLIKQDRRPKNGNDLTTIRIEKLLTMGAYAEALKLYNKEPVSAYHERFARAGILAGLYNRQSALACLEERAAQGREKNFENVSFWQQLSKICLHLLSNSKAETITFESAILQQVGNNPNFRYKVRKPQDLKALTPLEAAVLAADNRYDFSSFTLDLVNNPPPPHVLSLIRTDPSLPERTQFDLIVYAVQKGYEPLSTLSSFYLDTSEVYFSKNNKDAVLAGYPQARDWKRLSYLYRAIKNAEKIGDQEKILQKVFVLTKEYPHAALWPFAPYISASEESSPFSTIRIGLKILADSQNPLPQSWIRTWRKQKIEKRDFSKKDFLTYLGYLSTVGKPESEDQEPIDFNRILDILSPDEIRQLEILTEKLDKVLKLHNYDGSEAYEKELGLTNPVDYVMPLSGLLEDLKQAKDEQHLGEVILLSSIVLYETPFDVDHIGIYREVIDGLITVGLTEEARFLTRKVILGLK